MKRFDAMPLPLELLQLPLERQHGVVLVRHLLGNVVEPGAVQGVATGVEGALVQHVGGLLYLVHDQLDRHCQLLRVVLVLFGAMLRDLALVLTGGDEHVQLRLAHSREGPQKVRAGNHLVHGGHLVQQLRVGDPLRVVPDLLHHVHKGDPDSLALSRLLPDLRVHVQDDGQDHVKHEHDQQEHERPGPEGGRPPVLCRKVWPVVLSLHEDLEADTHGTLEGGEVLNSATKDEAAADGVGHKRRQHDDKKVYDVDETHLQRCSDDAQSGLLLEGNEETYHEEQQVHGHEDAEPRVHVGEPVHAIVHRGTKLVRLCGQILFPRVDETMVVRHDADH
mmetsp:Transcript_54764/g.123324  ORF Transcript_54764/g.123324 Transcript_54764/m.123324 type:complete len:334 (+) Transcript_54764:134-1135(+)